MSSDKYSSVATAKRGAGANIANGAHGDLAKAEAKAVKKA